MFDTKNPLSIATYTLVISFILFFILFYIVKPSWVQIVILKNNQNDEKPVISNILVISFRILIFSCCKCSICLVLLLYIFVKVFNKVWGFKTGVIIIYII